MLDKPVAGQKIRFTLNGKPESITCDPFASLAETLRETVGLTGTKTGCDAGDCGACTVLLNGEQVCSCLVAAGQADGSDIVTIEGAAVQDWIEKLGKSFLDLGAAQCGICTPGMIMAASDLLKRNATPDRAQVEAALGGVLCRCTGYKKIVDAVLAASRGQSETAAPYDETGAVGARLKRADGLAKVTGRDRFGADNAPDDALWLRAVRSPHGRATFEFGDLAQFIEQTDGLEAFLTHKDVPGGNGFGVFPELRHQPVFAEARVRFRGDPVAALIGERGAIEALDFDDLPITWRPEDPVTSMSDALKVENAPIHDDAPDNILTTGLVVKGATAQGHADAAVTVEGSFQTGFVEHAYIEPEAGFARLIGEAQDRIEVTACTQAPYMDLDEVAHVLGVDKSRVRIIPSACGGGFGGKLDVALQPMLAVAAWTLKKPVRAIMSRVESMASSTKRHPSEVWAKVSADKDGRLRAFELKGDFNTGAYASWGPTVAGRVPVHATGPYKVPHVHNTSRAIYTNENPSGAFRGFGVPQAAIAQEALFDDVADRLGIDLLEFRHINAIRAGDETATGQVLEHSCGLAECLDALREDWQAMRTKAAEHNVSGARTRRGAGIGCMWYGCGNTALSNPSSMRVELAPDGQLTLFNGAVDIGQGSTTVILQICADALGLPPARFVQVIGDTDLTEDAGKTSASRQTLVSGKAAELAGLDLRQKILNLANVGEHARLELEGAMLRVSEGDAERVIDLEQLPDMGGVVLEGHGTYDPPTTTLDDNGQGIPYAAYGFAAQIVDLEVHPDYGTVKLNRIVAAHDVGRAINPTLVEGQIHGGIAQGIGLALMEEYLPGRTENLHDYLIPTFGDVPEIDIRIIEDPEHHGPFGAKGIGEPALIPTAPAIFSAIRHATGLRITQAPALPHRIWAGLRQQEQTS
jgi:CO/xanthine dehydrogenase Mo-binding subunit/aerobic-type carbon monoxide dehydrogenase small subunit (CoxS/CutS family)